MLSISQKQFGVLQTSAHFFGVEKSVYMVYLSLADDP